jgi:G:T-mismatch repair DNA endonuclease (very short patch repair protein)
VFPEIEKSTIKINDKWFLPDAISVRDGIIIEFFGNFWHANPEMYTANMTTHNGITAQSVWDNDKIRIKKLEAEGYKVIIVWEKDYRKNPNYVINNLSNLLNWEDCAL